MDIKWGYDPFIKKETMEELVKLLELRYPGKWRYAIEVEVCPIAVIKTIDNEVDAQDTIDRLKLNLGILKIGPVGY